MVNSIRLDELARPGGVRSPRVISADSRLPGPVKAVVAAEDALDTTQAHCHSEDVAEVVPHHLSATLEIVANFKYERH